MSASDSINHSRPRPSLSAAGMVIWLGSETMFFAGLFAAYFTLRANTPVWPPAGTHLNVIQGAVFTGVLIASSASMHLAAQAAAGGDFNKARRWLAVTITLAAAFMANQAYEWSDLPFTVSSHRFGSAFFVMTGFHGLHVLGGMAAMGLLFASLGMRSQGADHEGAVEAVSFYWHFVDVVWLIMFTVLFLVR
ncbi:MAG: cytochrome c oxidase subunit 3 [Actinomycetota bacterium]